MNTLREKSNSSQITQKQLAQGVKQLPSFTHYGLRSLFASQHQLLKLQCRALSMGRNLFAKIFFYLLHSHCIYNSSLHHAQITQRIKRP